MLKFKTLHSYLDKYKSILVDELVNEDYKKIEECRFGKSLSPLTFHKNALFLGVGSGLEIIVFSEYNPNSVIIIIEEDKEKLKIISKLKNYNIYWYTSIFDYTEKNTEFDYVRVNQEFFSTATIAYLIEKYTINKICGEFYIKKNNPIEIYNSIRNRSSVFYFYCLDGAEHISGYKKNEKKFDISIIISVEEVNDNLVKCIKSLSNEKKLSKEILISYHGSKEAYKENIIEGINRKSVKILSETNSDCYSAWLAGFELSSGEYLLFIDGNDYLFPQMLEELFLLAVINHTDIAQCGFYNHGDKLPIENKYFEYEKEGKMSPTGSIENPRDYLLRPPSTWCRLYEKGFLDTLELNTPEDFENNIFSFISLSKAKRMAVIPDYYYIRNTKNKTIDCPTLLDTYIRQFDYIYRKVRPTASMEIMAKLLDFELVHFKEVIEMESGLDFQEERHEKIKNRIINLYSKYLKDKDWENFIYNTKP